MSAHPLHSSERMDWQTPPWFLDRVRAVASIAFDPATSPTNPTGALAFCVQSSGTCGLRAQWPCDGLTFVNPPYGAHLDGDVDPLREIVRGGKVIGVGTGWAKRIASHGGDWIALVPNRTETDWWGTLWAASDLFCLPSRRIAFVDSETGKVGGSPNHGSTVFYRGSQYGSFARSFRPVGKVLPGGRNAWRP